MSTMFVDKVVDYPVLINGSWVVKVIAEDFGVLRSKELCFDTKEEADCVGVGYRFIA